MNFIFITLSDVYSGECDIKPFKIVESNGVNFHLFDKEVYYDKKENKVKIFDFSDEELSNNVYSIFSEYGNNLYFRGICKKENFMFEKDAERLGLLVNKYYNSEDHKKAERAEKERIKLVESWVADDARVEWEDLEKLIDKYEIKIFSKTLERFRDNTIEELRKRVGYVNSDSFLVKGSGVFAFDPTVYYKKVRSILKHDEKY